MRSTASGSCWLTTGAKIASSAITAKTARPVMARRCRVNRRTTRLAGLSIVVARPNESRLGSVPVSASTSVRGSVIANPWVDQRIHDIGDQIRDQDQDRQDQRHPHDEGVIALTHPFEEE